jgi:DNA-binding response OmpR family regulator
MLTTSLAKYSVFCCFLTEGKMRILVVEDEKSLREIVASRLSREGYAVDTAADGTMALDCIEEGAYDKLSARVRALRRRNSEHKSNTLAFADLRVNLLSREVTRGGRHINLTAKEFSLSSS